MNNFFKKIFRPSKKNGIVIFIVFAFFISLSPNNKKAQAWDAMAANGMLFTMENVYQNIQDTIMSSIKMQYVIFVNEEIDNSIAMVTGEAGSALGVVLGVIDDWQAFLIQEPANQTASILEEFLFNATGGRSSSNYRTKVGRNSPRYSMASEGFGETIRYGLIRTASAQTTYYASNQKSYSQRMKEIDEAIREEKRKQWSLEPENPDYEKNPNDMFAKNNLRDFDLIISNAYDQWSHKNRGQIIAEQQYINKKSELYLRALIGEGIYKSDIRDAVDLKTVKAYTSTVDLEWLANAKGPVETAAAATVVAVNKVLKKSIKNIRKSYQQDLAAYRGQIAQSISANFTGARPQDVFKEQIQERQERQNKFGTGANYENINVDAEIKQRESLKNRTLTTGQIQER